MSMEFSEPLQDFSNTGELTFEARPTTEIVRLVEWHAQSIALDPRFNAAIDEHVAKMARIESEESTMEEEFGPSLSVEEFQEKLEQLYREKTGRDMPHRYPLPAHLHWIGDGIHDNYRSGP